MGRSARLENATKLLYRANSCLIRGSPGLPMSVLLITSNRLGDAVLTTGTVPHLAARYPDLPIIVACGALPAPLFEAMPEVAAVWPMVKEPRGGHWFKLWRRAIGRPWRHVVDLRGSAFAYSVLARRRTVLHTDHTLRHRVLHLTEGLGASAPVSPHVAWLPEHEAEARMRLPTGRPFLAIGPTANWAGKQWPATSFGEVAARLTGPGGPLADASILVAGAPDEMAAARPAIDRLPADRTVAAFGWPLPVLAAAFSRAALYIGNDSGLMHLAAAVGTPTLGLFGPSRDAHYAPWGECNRVIRTPAAYEDYLTPNGLDTERAARLMGEIQAGTVYAAAAEMLAERGNSRRD